MQAVARSTDGSPLKRARGTARQAPRHFGGLPPEQVFKTRFVTAWAHCARLATCITISFIHHDIKMHSNLLTCILLVLNKLLHMPQLKAESWLA